MRCEHDTRGARRAHSRTNNTHRGAAHPTHHNSPAPCNLVLPCTALPMHMMRNMSGDSTRISASAGQCCSANAFSSLPVALRSTPGTLNVHAVFATRNFTDDVPAAPAPAPAPAPVPAPAPAAAAMAAVQHRRNHQPAGGNVMAHRSTVNPMVRVPTASTTVTGASISRYRHDLLALDVASTAGQPTQR